MSLLHHALHSLSLRLRPAGAVRGILPLALLLGAALGARADLGDWHIYAAYHDAERVAEVGGLIFTLSDGGLYSYDPEDLSVETYDKSDLLSDYGIYDIRACEETGELVIVYDNGNIDLLSPGDGSVYNMPDFKTKTLSDKTINDMLVQEGWLYLSTNAGLLCVDLANRVFGNLYDWGQTVRSTVLKDGIFFATTPGGVFRADTDDNLLDPANWTTASTNTAIYNCIDYGSGLFCISAYVFIVSNVDKISFTRLTTDRVTHFNVVNGTLYAYSSTASKVFAFDEDGTCTTYTDTIGISHIIYAGSTYWAACGEKGLQAITFTDDQYLAVTTGSILPDSPRRNYSYKLHMEDGERLLIAGGWDNNGSSVMREGTVMVYEDDEWSAFDEDAIAEARGSTYYQNVTDVAQDPQDSNHHFVSAINTGLYEFRGGEYTGFYSVENSPLRSALATTSNNYYRYVRVGGLAYDDDNNLWMLNCETDTIVRILKADGSWTSLYIPEIEGHPTFDHILFDQRGWAWINDRRSTEAASSYAGIVVINTNGTIDSQGDDSYVYIYDIVNQDATTYSPTLCNCICEDLNGYIWIGNDRGIFVTYSPSDVFDDDFYWTQVKVPRNDGSGLADYLLSDVTVKCITIDGGNRKWVGTSGSGVFLLSEDGLETIEQFTADDSPLPSDDIYDIAVNPSTGEVFIATAEGLASYMGDATDPAAELDKDVVKVYPNPVRPEYSGKISITGLAYETDVKIVNAAGRLVNTGTSTGGMYTWDGRLDSGKQCASGVYYILATDSEGDNGVVAKFLIVRE